MSSISDNFIKDMPKKRYSKEDFVVAISEQTEVTQKQVNQIISLFLNYIVEATFMGATVHLRDLGEFKPKRTKGRLQTNFQTGERVRQKDYVSLKFRPVTKVRRKFIDEFPDDWII